MPRAFLIKNKKEKRAEKRKEKATSMETESDAERHRLNPVAKVSDGGFIKEAERETFTPATKKAKVTDMRENKHTPAVDLRSQDMLKLVGSWSTPCTGVSTLPDVRTESRGNESPTASTPSPEPRGATAMTPPRAAVSSPGHPAYHPVMGSPHHPHSEQHRREQLLWQSGYLRFPHSPPVSVPGLPIDPRYRIAVSAPMPIFNPLLAPGGHMATPDPRRLYPAPTHSVPVPLPRSFSPHSPSRPLDLKLPTVRPTSLDSYPRSMKEFETNRDAEADKNPSDAENQVPLDLVSSGSYEGKKKPGPPRFQCDACKKSYSTFNGLSKHKEFHCASHVKREFSCQHCEKTYNSLGALKMHIRTHTLPCKCKLCGKAFSRPWLLQGHVRTHTGEKPFTCQHCGRAFADRSNLRAHLQTHTDIKKYNCKNCAKTFSRMSLLLKHQEGSCLGLVR